MKYILLPIIRALSLVIIIPGTILLEVFLFLWDFKWHGNYNRKGNYFLITDSESLKKVSGMKFYVYRTIKDYILDRKTYFQKDF